MENISWHRAVSMGLLGMDGMSWKSIFVSKICMNIIERNKENDSYRPRTFVRGIPVTENDMCFVHPLNILIQNNNTGAKNRGTEKLYGTWQMLSYSFNCINSIKTADFFNELFG